MSDISKKIQKYLKLPVSFMAFKLMVISTWYVLIEIITIYRYFGRINHRYVKYCYKLGLANLASFLPYSKHQIKLWNLYPDKIMEVIPRCGWRHMRMNDWLMQLLDLVGTRQKELSVWWDCVSLVCYVHFHAKLFLQVICKNYYL